MIRELGNRTGGDRALCAVAGVEENQEKRRRLGFGIEGVGEDEQMEIVR